MLGLKMYIFYFLHLSKKAPTLVSFFYRKERDILLCWEIIHRYQAQFSGADFCLIGLKRRYWDSKKWKSWTIQASRRRWVSGRGCVLKCSNYLCLSITLWFHISGIWLLFESSSTNENVWRYKIFTVAKEINSYSKFIFEAECS